MLRLAITGGLCSGKSTVSNRLRERGCPVVDADAVGHQLLGEVESELVAHFGRGIIENGAVSRSRLAARVFGAEADAGDRGALNQILHPRIMAAAEAQLRRWAADGVPAAGVDAALLIEEDLLGGFDRVMLVVAPLETRVARYIARGGSREQALARIATQWEDDRKRPHADIVIDNGGSLAATHAQVDAAMAHAMAEWLGEGRS